MIKRIAIPKKWLTEEPKLIHSILLSYEVIPYNGKYLGQYLEDIKECVAIVSDVDYFGKELMDHMKNLRLISLPGTGYWDFVNVKEASKRNIAVANIKNYGSDAITEYTIGLMIAAARNILPAHRAVIQNNRETNQFIGISLKGKTLGIIGLGSIGTKVATLANAFGMNVLCYTKRPNLSRSMDAVVTFCKLEELFTQSDIVSLHLELNDETKGIVGRKEIEMMPNGAYFINTARGALVDTDALYDALYTKKLSGAALDVTDPEPLPKNHKLLTLDNIILTPHIAVLSREAVRNSVMYSLKNIADFFQGTCNNIVNSQELIV